MEDQSSALSLLVPFTLLAIGTPIQLDLYTSPYAVGYNNNLALPGVPVLKNLMKRTLFSGLLPVLLIACGGGGGNDGGNTGSGGNGSAATFALDAAQTAMLTLPRSFSANATNGADAYRMSISLTPNSDAVFEGATSRRTTQTLTITRNGATINASTFENYFQLSPWRPAGAIYSNGTYGVVTVANSQIPNSATIGSSGSVGTLTLYSNSSKSTVLLRQEATWTLESDTANTAWFCTNAVLRDAVGSLVSTSNGCTRIDAAGNPLGIRWTLSVDGVVLRFS